MKIVLNASSEIGFYRSYTKAAIFQSPRNAKNDWAVKEVLKAFYGQQIKETIHDIQSQK